MSLPTTTDAIITATDFNATQVILEDILSISENGWGLTAIQSNQVSTGKRVYASDWNSLLSDLNTVHQHITGGFTSTAAVITGTTVINHNLANDLYDVTQSLIANRYSVNPNQFLISDGGSSTIFYGGGDSLRTLPWGIDTNVITHRVVTQFPNRLAARYYFNLGCYLTYTPYYSGTGLNDLDAEWANFIDYLRDPAQTYTYDRQKFVSYDSTTTAWTSGTLHVSITADRAADFKSIEFIVEYRNDATPELLISPAVGIYTITL
jgi:hypothetical protein